MRALLCITLLLSTPSVASVRAGECEAKAAEIAGQIGLDAGGLGKDDAIALSSRTDEEDGYGAYLLCRGPLGMTLLYLSPPWPGPKWYDFVARSGAILTGVKSTAMRWRRGTASKMRACAMACSGPPARRCGSLAA